MVAPFGVAARVLEEVADHLPRVVLREVGGATDPGHVFEIVGPDVVRQGIGQKPGPGRLAGAAPPLRLTQPQAPELLQQLEHRRQVRHVLLADDARFRDHAKRPGRPEHVPGTDVPGQGSPAVEGRLPIADVVRQLPSDQVSEAELAQLVGLDDAVAVAPPQPGYRIVGVRVLEVVGTPIARRAVVGARVRDPGPGPGRIGGGRPLGELVIEHTTQEVDDATVARVGVVGGGAAGEAGVERRGVVGPAPASEGLAVEAAIGEPGGKPVLLHREAREQPLPGQLDDAAIGGALRLDPGQEASLVVENEGMAGQGLAVGRRGPGAQEHRRQQSAQNARRHAPRASRPHHRRLRPRRYRLGVTAEREVRTRETAAFRCRIRSRRPCPPRRSWEDGRSHAAGRPRRSTRCTGSAR